MAMEKSTCGRAILAILHEAKQAGVGGVLRTALIKYLYLLDLLVAREKSGETFTGTIWRFHHYGPYADSCVAELDELAKTPTVECHGSAGKSKDYCVYKLGEYGTADSLESLGLSFDVRSNLGTAIRRYASDLSGLLDYVYFNTEPMANAKPGDVLEFSGASNSNYKRDIRPIDVPAADPKRLEHVRMLLKKLGDNWAKRAQEGGAMSAPILDEHYGATTADADLSAAAGSYKGRLLFEGD